MTETNDPAANYRKMDRADFDAIVTGELTHYARWLEQILEAAIENYFAVSSNTRERFRRLVLQRDGMTFQNKIDLVRSIVREGQFDDADRSAWIAALTFIEELKRIRNAMAHGTDSGGDGLEIKVEYVNRSGKAVEIEVTPDTHVRRLGEMDQLYKQVEELAARFKA